MGYSDLELWADDERSECTLFKGQVSGEKDQSLNGLPPGDDLSQINKSARLSSISERNDKSHSHASIRADR
ncbi:MAG: hypothetical protein AAFP81_19350, partial [Pseudomonadota bacterium]